MLVALVLSSALAIWFWWQVQRMELAVAELVDRIRSLEEWRAGAPAQRPIGADAAKPAPPLAAPQVAPTVPSAQPPPTSAPPVRPPAAPTPPTPPPLVAPPAPTPTVPSPSQPRVEAPRPVAAASAAQTVSAPIHPSTQHEALETRIGSRWLLYVGVTAIVIGVAYFEKLAIDNHWIGETARVIQGAIVGLLLVGAGLQFVRRGYQLYGQLLSGSGVAILYVSTYAAFNFYHLIPQPIAFALMCGVTTLAAWLADRQRSQGLALVAVGGGFATPFLLPSPTDAEAALFGYDAILIAGTMFLARRRDWPLLNIVSYAFTVMTVGAWGARFYTPDKYLTTEIFLTVFCGMFLYILREIGGSDEPTAWLERAILWTAPAGYYYVSLAILMEHSTALLVYLIALSLVGVIVSTRVGSAARLVFWVAVAAPLLWWSRVLGGREWLAAGLATWTAVYVLNLAGLVEATLWKGRRFTAADLALLHVNGLVSFGGAYLLIDPIHASATAPLAAALAVLNGTFAWLLLERFRDEALHFAALGFTLLTIATALQFEGAAMTSGWAAEGAVVAWLGLRERREWLRAGGLVLFAVAVLSLLTLQFAAPRVGELVLLNSRALCGLFVVALSYGLAFVHHRYVDSSKRDTPVAVALLVAKLLVLTTTVGEIVAYWSLHIRPPFEPAAQAIDATVIVGATIVWLGLRRRQEWLRAAGALVVGVAAYALFVIQLQGAPADYVTLLNGRAAAGALTVVTMYVLAIAHRRWGGHLAQQAATIAILITSASLLTLSLLTSEIDAFWSARGAADVWSIAREGLQAIAWGGIGGFLIWQGLANRRVWVRATGGALLLIGILRLLRLQFAATTPGDLVLANARVIASIVIIAIVYGLASLYRYAVDPEEGRDTPATVLWLVANVLTLTLLTSEITAYWDVHDLQHVSSAVAADSRFAREMMLSITWAAYATLLIVIGLRRRYAPIRYFAMTVFVVTIVKVFLVDLAELDRLYRVISVIGLGVMLLLTSYLYQQIAPDAGDDPATDASPRKRRPFWVWLLTIGAIVGALAGYAAMTELVPNVAADALLYPLRRPVRSGAPAGCVDTTFTGARGITLKGWRCNARAPRIATVVLLHGVADNRESMAGVAARFAAKGFDVVAYDSRAHGESAGAACTYGYWEKHDLDLVMRQVGGGPTLLLGNSLGAAVALQEAPDDGRVIGIVAADVFSDLQTVARERAPRFLTEWMIRRALAMAEARGDFRVEEVSPIEAAKRLTIPVLLIHGAADTETVPDHSRRIFAALRGPKELMLVPGARHSQSLGSADTWQRIDQWVDDLMRMPENSLPTIEPRVPSRSDADVVRR